MVDSELEKGSIYWAEITDPELKTLLGSQIKVKFTGVFFRDIESPYNAYYLSQLKIFREYKEVKE